MKGIKFIFFCLIQQLVNSEEVENTNSNNETVAQAQNLNGFNSCEVKYLNQTEKGDNYYTSTVWYKNRVNHIWNFGARNNVSNNQVIPQKVYFPEYLNNTIAGDPILSFLPCDFGSYSDVWTVWKLYINSSFPLNHYTSVASVEEDDDDFIYENPPVENGTYAYAPIAKFNSEIIDDDPKKGLKAEKFKYSTAWYKGQRVRFFDFGAAKNFNIIPIYYVYTKNGSTAGDPIVNQIPGDLGFSPIYLPTNMTVADKFANGNDFKNFADGLSYTKVPGKSAMFGPVSFTDTNNRPSGTNLSNFEETLLPVPNGSKSNFQSFSLFVLIAVLAFY